MNYSLNETGLLAKRAARGAGYCWSLAEEAGKAVRWLCARDVDGARQMALLLQRGFAADRHDHRPQQMQGVWQGRDMLCPIMPGCLLSDCASRLRGDVVSIGALAAPALLLPFAANAARILGGWVSVGADGWQAGTDGTELGVELGAGDVFPEQVEEICVQAGSAVANLRRRCSRATPDPVSWEILEHLAHKTYAPATEESRRLGAG